MSNEAEHHNQNDINPIQHNELEISQNADIKKVHKKKVKKKNTKKKKGIHLGIGSLMLVFFCSFLIVAATFVQLDVSHLYIPGKFWSGETSNINDFIFSIRYIPQIPVIMFIIGLLGRRLGFISILLYIIAGLFFVPVFALGGGWRYIFEYSFGYILAYLPAAVIVGSILKKDYSYKNVAKAVTAGVIAIHLSGILYMLILAYFKHAGWGFAQAWISAQSGIKIIYDLIFSYLAILFAKYARIILWFYL